MYKMPQMTKSGDGAKRLIEREKWIIAMFFLPEATHPTSSDATFYGLAKKKKVSVNVPFIYVTVMHGCQTRFKVKVARKYVYFSIENYLRRRWFYLQNSTSRSLLFDKKIRKL